MTTLEKLGIQGVRSFGGNHLETVSFQKPLTLLVGPNGAGKTTIVECLKMACTGELPPNADKGKAFIYDPKLAKAPEVKGQIRLLFKNAADKRICIIRSFQLTNTKDAKGCVKSSFKALESVLQTKSSTGEMTSISQKCADMDTQVPQLMGVSKAVLENVIFCHQDDSTWPLSAMGDLKKKFDDLFGATRYTNALKAITDVRKQVTESRRVLQTEVDSSRIHLTQAKHLRQQLQEAETAAQSETQHIRSGKEEESKRLQELQSVQNMYNEIQKYEVEYRMRNESLERCKQKTEELHNNLEEVYEEDMEQLMGYRNQFYKEIEQHESNRAAIEAAILFFEEEVTGLEFEISETQQRYSDGYRAEATLLNAEAERTSVVNHLKMSLQMQEFVGITEYRRKLEEFDFNNKRSLDLFKEDCETMEKMYTDLMNEKTRLNADKYTTMAVLNRLEEESSFLRCQSVKMSELKELENRLEDQLRCHDTSTDGDMKDVESLKEELFVIDEKTTQLQIAMEAMELKKYRIEETKQINLVIHSEVENKKRLELEEQQMSKQFIELFEADGEKYTFDNNWNAVDRMIQQRLESSNMKRDEASFEECEMNVCRKEGEVQLLEEEENQIRMKLMQIKQNLSNSFSFDVNDEFLCIQLDELKEKEKQLRNDLLITQNAEQMYSNFLNYSMEKSKCAFCCRKLVTIDEKEKMRSHVLRKMENLPNQISVFEEELSDISKKLDEVERNKFQLIDFQKLKESEKSINSRLEDMKEKLMGRREESAELKRQCSISREECRRHRVLQTEVLKLMGLQKKIEDSRRRLEEVEGVEVEEVESVLSINTELKRLTCEVNELRLKRNAVNELYHTSQLKRQQTELEVQRLKNEKNECSRLIRECIEKSHKLQNVEEDKRLNLKHLNDMETELEMICKRIEDLLRELNDKKRERDELQRKLTSEGLVHQQNINLFDRLTNQIEEAKKSLQQMSGLGERLEELRKRKEEKLILLNEKKKARSDLQETIQQIKLLEINLIKNLEFKQKEKEMEEEQKKLQDLQNMMGNIKIEELKMQLETQNRQLNKLQLQIATSEGALAHRMEMIGTLKRNLSASIYTNIEDKFRQSVIAAETNNVATKDLAKYHMALHKALMKYHSMKMQEINQTIKELWQTVYTGRDIDSIAIRSDADADEATLGVGQRSYNYRVVMIKGETELEMRGRCSAGQKVLASLIIRLALAESFCLNCGIIVLDEPTTNLDQYNVENFAKALSELIEVRKANQNFQLILITHDEEFVLQLAKHSMCDVYYKIEKDENGHSMIHQADIRVF